MTSSRTRSKNLALALSSLLSCLLSGLSNIGHPCRRHNTHPLLRKEIDEHRAGTTVSRGLKLSLSLLVLQNVVEVHVEEISRVLRSTLSFGVELGGEDWARCVDDAYKVVST